MPDYPETQAKRRAGMAAFRKRMLAAHERVLASGILKPKDAAQVTEYRDAIKSAQRKFGET